MTSLALELESLAPTTANVRVARRLVAVGRVQGVGFRPAVARLATELGLAGTVCNTTAGVELLIEGDAEAVEQFCDSLASHLPPQARVEKLHCQSVAPAGRIGFVIEARSDTGSLSVSVPTDLATCAACLAEVDDVLDRRHRYPLTSCTACGPRYSIIETMPYERSATTMSRFALCSTCDREFTNAADRRLHAQTNACPTCGPRVWCADDPGAITVIGDEAIRAAVRAIRDGKIVALKGLGGYQLLVDATNSAAVARLRTRKGRPAKPLAVLVDSLATAERLAILSDDERETLSGAAGPIVIARARSVSQFGTVGLLLPTTPLHTLIAHECGPVVATSGNRDGEPLAFDAAAAERELAGIADLWLHHDRPIRRPIDDSVVRVIAGRAVTIRLGRGLAPLPLAFSDQQRGEDSVLAVGGHQKVAIALTNGSQALLGPYIGDLDTVAARERFDSHVADLLQLYRTTPRVIAHDLHSDYFTTRWAAARGAAMIAVQHHHAHIAAAMLEHQLLDRTVLGVAWDGTGYGPDGTIWGGEFLIATATGFRRVARLRPFVLPGGEAAIREPWRVVAALLHDANEPAPRTSDRFMPSRMRSLAPLLSNPHLSPTTTSAGRLFDAVAALILPDEMFDGCSAFEGHAAMLLEAACDESVAGTYPFPLRAGEPTELDWRPLITEIMSDQRAGVAPGAIAMRFHRAAADAIFVVCAEHAEFPVVLGGGVFQNRVLVELLAARFAAAERWIGLPGMIPPNDGGLAAGQLAVALAQIEKRNAE